MAHHTPPLPLMLLLCTLSVNSSFQPALVLEMAKILLENYCFPEILVGMEEAIQKAINSGEILQISDRKTLASVLTNGVQALNDPRLTVSYEPNFIPGMPQMLPSLPIEKLIWLVRNSVKLDILDNNIGYLRIDRIIGEETATKLGSLLRDNIWDKVAHTSSMILDLRYSTAGELSGVPFIISYFSEPEPLIHLDTVYDRPLNTTMELWTMPSIMGERYGKKKDLIILTSKRTVGAAEAVAYTLKSLKRAITVGERSAGGSVKIQKIRIPHSDFYITVPVARSVNPITGHSWEVSGVSPTVNVLAKEAVAKAKSLLAVRSAIPKVVQSIADVIRRFYVFTDRVPALLQYLQSTDFFSVISEEDLAVRLNQDLQSVSEDPRLIIKYMQDNAAILEKDPELENIPDDLESLKKLVDTIKVEILLNNTGYLRIDKFFKSYAGAKLEELIAKKVWEPLKDTNNLIIDLRYNTGGSSTSLALILSYLQDTSQKHHFFTINDQIQNITTKYDSLPQTAGPTYGSKRGVYVLTSYDTASTGEEFAYLIQSLHRGTVIGEITSGTLMHSKSFQIEGMAIAITVPFINFVDNNGECWLGGGVVPDAIALAEEAVEHVYEIADFHQGLKFLIEGTGELLEKHYTVHEVAQMASKVLFTKWAEGLYRSVVDFESLASQLTADLQETSGDHRLHVFHCDVEPKSLHDVPKIPTAEEVGYIIDALFKIELLLGNVGYVRFNMMADVEVVKAIGPQLIKLVWSKLVNTDALIIDMRYNTGGYSTAIPLFSTYFFDAQPLRHLYTVFDRTKTTLTKVMTLPQVRGPRYGSSKDVYILTSQMTGSAAEVFTHSMKDLNRATIIGEPTIGGSLSSGTYQIRDSVLYASIPNQLVLSAVTGKEWSISGVEPHVTASANDALTVAQRLIVNLRAQVHAIIEGSATLIADNYAFEDIGANVAEKLKGLLANGEYSTVVSKESLEVKLSADLKTLSGDKSLKTTHNTPALPPMDYSPEMYIELIKVSFHTDIFENNIGYLRFDMFGDFEEVKAIAQIIVEHVWNKVVNTDAMIVDLRNNLGGPTTAIAGFCSYFFDADKQIVLDKLYNRPSGTITELRTLPELTGTRYGSKKSLIILTSGATAGAAEEFVYIMKKLGRAMIIGETTAGASHPPETFRVGETDIFLSIPTIHSDTTAGPAWEGAGIAPHIPVPADAALETAKGIFNKHFAGQKTTS
ncbi:retinol-binding protein 3 isoform X2 [Etheostoma spectabile]|uniref:retinol-binding protein 3 isoform X2 n=1 Tax=Etheostoma spectabile TaxID=54343 RepID=UPI0013AF0B98|nr:retinol-binding protein 3-like isoform X2 [Etheostoma spectabile]